MHRAVEVDARTAPEYYAHRRELAAPGRAADAEGLPDRQPAAQRLRHRPQSRERRRRRHDRPARAALPRGSRRRHGARTGACQEPRHADDDDHRDLAGAISMLGNFAFFFGGNRDNNNPLGFVGVLVAMIVAPLAAHARADGDQPHARIFRRPRAAPRSAAIRCGWPPRLPRSPRGAAASPIRTPSATRRPRISSSSIRCRASGMDNLFSTHPARRTASRR